MPVKAKCDDCGQEFETDDEAVHRIPHLLDRVESGGEMPVAECPECGALAYLVEKPPQRRVRESRTPMHKETKVRGFHLLDDEADTIELGEESVYLRDLLPLGARGEMGMHGGERGPLCDYIITVEAKEVEGE